MKACSKLHVGVEGVFIAVGGVAVDLGRCAGWRGRAAGVGQSCWATLGLDMQEPMWRLQGPFGTCRAHGNVGAQTYNTHFVWSSNGQISSIVVEMYCGNAIVHSWK